MSDILQHERVNLRLAIAVVACFIILFVLRLPGALSAHSHVLFNTDEYEMTLSAADRFLGVPSVSLAWPGGTLQLISVPAIVLRFVGSMSLSNPLNSFVDYLAVNYRDPWQLIAIERIIVAIVFSLGLASLLLPFVRLHGRLLTAGAVVLMAATTPEVWMHSHIATADAMALGLAALAVSALFLTRRDAPSWPQVAGSGFLLGLAIAAKVTAILLLPFFVGLMWAQSRRSIVKGVVFLAFVFLGASYAVPYIWVDPMRLAKSILGNASRGGEPMGYLTSAGHLASVVSVALLVFAGAGAIRLLLQRSFVVSLGAMASIAVTILITGRAGVVFDRYFIPMLLPVAYLAAYGVDALFDIGDRLVGRAANAVISIGLAAAAAFNVMGYWSLREQTNASSADSNGVAEFILKQQCTSPVVVPTELIFYLAKHASSRSLMAMRTVARQRLNNGSVGTFAASRGLTPEVIKVLEPSMTEFDQAFAARLTAMAYPFDRQGLDIMLAANDGKADRIGIMPYSQADAAYNSKQYCLIVLNGEYQGNLQKVDGAKVFGPYIVLMRQ